MGVSRRILIQTAKEETFNIESDEKLTTRLLLDSGSEYTYITDNFRKLLKLKTKRTEKVLIKTFGQINGSQMQASKRICFYRSFMRTSYFYAS